MDRKAVAVGVLFALTFLTGVPGRAAIQPGPGENLIAYVADVEGSWVGCGVCNTLPVRIAPTGKFFVYPQGRSFTLNIDDFGAQDGALVWMSLTGNGLHFGGCVPVRTVRTFTAQSPGEGVYVVLHATRAVQDCPATAGVVTATGVV